MGKLAKALSASAGNAGGDKLYVEDVFSSYLYVGNTNSNKITNGIDLAGEGGLVWIKNRGASQNNWLLSEDLGSNSPLSSNLIDSAATNVSNWFGPNPLYTFNNDGFTTAGAGQLQTSNNNYVSWTFRKAEKFFDVVTYTGNGASSRTIAHSLGSVPGMMTVKGASNISGWRTYHTSLGATKYVQLQTDAAAATYNVWNDTTPTDSVFSISTDINANGVTYVAYLFASDAGGFGDDGNESIIKCGSYVDSGSEITVNLGWEPQYILLKNSTDASQNWWIFDTTRGWPGVFDVAGGIKVLYSNLSNSEAGMTSNFNTTATGFVVEGNEFGSGTYIYMAIRRPMKTPTAGTEVFTAVRPSSSGTFTAISGFPTDFTMNKGTGSGDANYTGSRLQGANSMQPQTTAAEFSVGFSYDFMDRITIAGSGNYSSWISWNFKRAPGFMDVCTVTTSGYAATVTHNLGVTPELIIGKARNSASPWAVWNKDLNIVNSNYTLILNNATAGANNGTPINSVGPTTFYAAIAASAVEDQVFYLFATVAGVSKVGTYTGTAGNLNVDCGFSAGARFILIKRTDSTGDWHVYDSARGITAAGTNDPYLLLNSTAAEVTNTDYIALLSSGFTVTSSAPAALNASGGSYLFLAIS